MLTGFERPVSNGLLLKQESRIVQVSPRRQNPALLHFYSIRNGWAVRGN